MLSNKQENILKRDLLRYLGVSTVIMIFIFPLVLFPLKNFLSLYKVFWITVIVYIIYLLAFFSKARDKKHFILFTNEGISWANGPVVQWNDMRIDLLEKDLLRGFVYQVSSGELKYELEINWVNRKSLEKL